MKIRVVALCFVGSLLASSAALAVTTDDVKWINQCVRDSAGMAGSQKVKLAYCTCMVNKMDDNETRSVTQWEKVNVSAARACAKESGWE